ncbi:MAG: hypothetical protein JXQ73_20725 [Phycisphaerae bacterium]|nr:hypothetical protein [Phycisphaerae bacterium]
MRHLLGKLICTALIAAPGALGTEPDGGRGAEIRAGRSTPQERLDRLQSAAELQQRTIVDLESKISTAASEDSEAARVEEIKRVVLELLSDGGFRESLYPDMMEVGYEEGFYLRSSDETFLLNITGMMQFRWIGTNRQTDDRRLQGRSKQDDINGFEMQYVVLNFDGYIHDPKLTYLISVIGDTDQGHDWQTYYAQVNYEIAEQLTFSAGILDLPQGFNALTADNKQLFVDRSLAEETFGLGYSIGVALSGLLFGKLEYAVGVFNGVANSSDSPSLDQLDTNFAYAASMIYHILGDGVGDDETDLPYSKDPLWDVGMNFAYNDDNGDQDPTFFHTIPDRIRSGRGIGGYGETDLTGTDYYQFGAHTAFRYRGFSLTGEWYMRTVDGNSEFSEWEMLTGRSGATHFQGGYVQASYFIIPKKFEVAARMGGIWDAGDNGWEYTFGANYYPFESHNFKIQADFTRIEEAPLDSGNGNWFQNDDTNMFRVAVQAAF